MLRQTGGAASTSRTRVQSRLMQKTLGAIRQPKKRPPFFPPNRRTTVRPAKTEEAGTKRPDELRTRIGRTYKLQLLFTNSPEDEND